MSPVATQTFSIRQLAIGNSLVHVVGLAPTKDNENPSDLQSGAFAAQPHMQKNFEFRISDLEFEMALC
jgi:hypothetical protein